MATIQTSLSIWQALKNLLRFCSIQFSNIKRWVDLKTHACQLPSSKMILVKSKSNSNDYSPTGQQGLAPKCHHVKVIVQVENLNSTIE